MSFWVKTGNLAILLKSLYTNIFSQALTMDFGVGTEAQGMPNTYRDNLSCVAQSMCWRDGRYCPWVELSSLMANRHHLSCVEHSLQFNQIWISFSQVNTTQFILTTPRNPAPPQSSTDYRQVVVSLVVPSDFCWLASSSALTPNLNLHEHGEHHSHHSADSLRLHHTQLVMPMALSEADWWAEDQISNLEDKVADNTKSEKQKVIINEGSLNDLWDDIKHNNIHINRANRSRREKNKRFRTYLKKLWMKISIRWWKK